jgi:ketosteroid isomerase-like protein
VVSQENVEIVREALESGVPLTDYERLAPDAEFDFTAFPDQRLLRGVQEMRAFRDSGPFGRSVSFAVERYFDVDEERVLVFVRATMVGQQSGAPVDNAGAQEFTLRGGLIVRMKVYADRSEALRAVGLKE